MLSVCAALTACGSNPLTAVESRVDQAVVTDVVDGDTIVLGFSANRTERIRLLGIDTPETSDPTRPVQCYGAEATDYLTELLPPGTTVRVERDIEARDQYGRLLAYIFRASDDLFINEALVRGGFADISFYEPNTTYQDTLTHAVTEARTSEAGLWLSCGGPDVALEPSQYELD